MNAKKCKRLRRIARSLSNVGEPLRQLVMFKQLCTPVVIDGKTRDRTTFGAVNNPNTFRGRYRTLKNKRTIDVRRIEAAADMMRPQANPVDTIVDRHNAMHHALQAQKQPKTFLQRIRDRVTRMFRHQAR